MIVRIAWNREISDNFFSMRFVLPNSVEAIPGQFVMVNVRNSYDPLLPRPFSIAYNDKNKLDIIYEVKGKGTNIMSYMEKGEELVLTGPLGNGFSEISKDKSVVFVAGGVGLPPVLFYIKRLLEKGFDKKKIFLFQGARDSDSLILKDEIENMRINYYFSTDDGSLGEKGLITGVLEKKIAEIKDIGKVFTVGPNPMMKKVVEISRENGVDVEVSMETNMACGIGACLGCILKPVDKIFVKKGYLKTCKDGPVFPGEYFY